MAKVIKDSVAGIYKTGQTGVSSFVREVRDDKLFNDENYWLRKDEGDK